MPYQVAEPIPPVAGSPGLVQGRYGDAGNLELAVPAADDGIWVFWFNADPVEHRAGAAQGCWSSGLHVFAGHHVDVARISQVSAGPDYLELLAVSDATLHRLYWTPDRGFVDAGPIATDVADVEPLRETDAELLVDVRGTDGTRYVLAGDKLRYPFVSWTARPTDSADESERPDVGIGHDAIAWADTTIDGGRTDVVLRVGAGLVHLHGDADSWSDPEQIVSRVWVEDAASGSVHRR